MLIVENHINVVGEDELDNDSREVFKEDKETVEANLTELRAWISNSAHLKADILRHLLCLWSPKPKFKKVNSLTFTVVCNQKRKKA